MPTAMTAPSRVEYDERDKLAGAEFVPEDQPPAVHEQHRGADLDESDPCGKHPGAARVLELDPQ